MAALDSDTGTHLKPHAPEQPILAVDIIRRTGIWKDVEDGSLVRAARAAFAAACEGASQSELSLLLTNDEEIAALNKNWRKKNGPTNVLSFRLDAPCGNDGIRAFGDVVLARETILREAEARGIPVRQHAVHLVVHGVLHLMGYDHADDKEAAEMEDLEVRILASLGVPDPYSSQPRVQGEGP